MALGTDAMTFGVHTVATDETIHPLTLGRALEERGFAALFLADHSHIPVDSGPVPRGGEVPRMYAHTLDPFAALSLVAGITERLLLGTGVALLMQRDPIQTAKEVASLDYLSGGRVIFGIGAGWNQAEMRNHGTDPRTRGALLDERMAAIIEIWTHDAAEYHGEYVDFDPISAWPKPIQQPHPLVLVGGQSPRAIARAKRFGGWMPSAHGLSAPEQLAALVGSVGPDVPVIPNGVTPDPATIDACRQAGMAGLTFHLPQLSECDALRLLDDWADLIN
jgi:probable F420-dependent oxidoreductase